jgi:hypothetical protein
MKGDEVTIESTINKANRMRTRWRSGGLAVLLVVGAAIGLAACGGGSADPPRVASVGTNPSNGSGSSGSTTTTQPTGNPTKLLDEWADCMQSNGDPNQADPTVDTYGVIHVTIPSDAQSVSNAVHAGTDPCNNYMAAAESALQAANPVAPPPDEAELLKYVACMRANGVPNYPYPTGNTTNFGGTGVDPNSPSVENASKLCGEKLSLPGWWISGNGPPGDVVVSSGGANGSGPPPNAVPGANGASGATPIPGTPGA